MVNDLELQVAAIDFFGSAIAVGRDEVLAFDDGRGLWIALKNSTNEINKIIEKAKVLVSPVISEEVAQS